MIRKVTLRGNSVPDSTLDVLIIVPTLAKRVIKSLGLLSMLLFVTALSALIPMVHFVLVPLMLLVTFVVGISALRKSEIIQSGEGTCPYCKALFRVFTRRYKLPFTDTCESCHRQVIVLEIE